MSCGFKLSEKFKPISVSNKDKAGGDLLGPKSQGFWYVDGGLVMTQGGKVAPHGKRPHRDVVMAEGSPWYVLIDGSEEYSCREGDAATCCHTASGRPWWVVT